MKKKNIYPTIKKKISNFMTDESGKVTKNSALGAGVIGLVLGSLDGVEAHHCDNSDFTSGEGNDPGSKGSYTNTFTAVNSLFYNEDYYASPSCGHGSGIFNGTRTILADSGAGGTSISNTGGSSWNGPGLPSNANSCNSTGMINTTNSDIYYLDCGEKETTVNGHFSFIGTTGNSRETVNHTNSHSNY